MRTIEAAGYGVGVDKVAVEQRDELGRFLDPMRVIPRRLYEDINGVLVPLRTIL